MMREIIYILTMAVVLLGCSSGEETLSVDSVPGSEIRGVSTGQMAGHGLTMAFGAGSQQHTRGAGDGSEALGAGSQQHTRAAGDGSEALGAGSQQHTRAFGDTLTGNAAASRLDSLFYLYGWKNEELYIPRYEVVYTSTTTHNKTNLDGWDYVDATKGQGERQWDLSARQYVFAAYSNPGGKATVSDVTREGMKVAVATAEALSGLYLAERVVVPQAKIDTIKPVYFTFRNAASKVRLCVYESVPMYRVKDIVFRYDGDTKYSRTNAVISGLFADAKAGATFDVSYGDSLQLPQLGVKGAVTNFDFGRLDSGEGIGQERVEPTWAGGTDAYHYVYPQPDCTTDARLVVNYTLVSDDGLDTIRVKGANVTIPARYLAWKANHAYTYIIKISKKTNGTTGNDPKNPDPADGDDPNKPDSPRGVTAITFTAEVESSYENEN